MDKNSFIYCMRKRRKGGRMEEKIYEHLSDFGPFCLVYGLTVAIAGTPVEQNFYCMDWHCSDPLCTGRIASYGNMGQECRR